MIFKIIALLADAIVEHSLLDEIHDAADEEPHRDL
jgi:hypothetical protein